MAGNSNLRNADKAKNDEFYTQLSDIEAELKHYRQHFTGKTVLCNCDDPFESNFFKYFAMNFNYLGLKKLIATCYSGSPVVGGEFDQLSLFSVHGAAAETLSRYPYKIGITEVRDLNGDGAVDLVDVQFLIRTGKNVLTLLQGNGDFRSDECIALLKETDIVVTNPPFSLFREYVAQLMKYEKKFLIIGNKNAITYKEIFPLLKENKMWLGYRNINADMWFIVPDDYKYEKIVDGKKVKHIMGCWLTNLDHKRRHEELELYKKYTPEEYPKYDNYDAINVDKTADIPEDYFGVMGVPITFLDKYNPEQFEIIDGIGRYSILDNENTKKAGKYLSMINGKAKFFRIVIKRRKR